MPRNAWYRQCTLVKKVEHGDIVHVAFLSDSIAKVGKVVRFKDDDGTWSEGWTVDYAGPKRPGDLIEANAEGHKHHRKRTDV